MKSKLKVKFLTAIWGRRYIREFAEVSLPSYIAAGNLPFLAAYCDLEVLVMTSESSRAFFEAEPLFARLSTLCPVHFIYIDDLITTGVYGVTLSLAYARGILSTGEEQTDTYFVFMNSDFVLADGAFQELLHWMEEGHPCIMAPSLRAQSETVVPILSGLVDPGGGTLAILPRQLVRIAFDNLHPTVIGKTVSQDFVTSRTHNQVYYQVDSETLLARHHLIFMLAIKPERPMAPVNSYCDYGFVPELVPSGRFVILDDSDRFFMLEMQSSAQELAMLRCGGSDPGGIAKELSFWTTREHRRFADVDVIFHTRDLPAELPQARAALQRFMRGVQTQMSGKAKRHKDHYYWVSGVQAWCMLRSLETTDPITLPPELAIPDVRRPWLLRVAGRAVRHARRHSARLLGIPLYLSRRLGLTFPKSLIWHHFWLDLRLARHWVGRGGFKTATRSLLVTSGNSFISQELSRLTPFSLQCRSAQLLGPAGPWGPHAAPLTGMFDLVLLHVFRSNVRQTRSLVERIAPHVRPGGNIAVFVEHLHGETDPTDFSVELASYILDVFPGTWIGQRVEARFVGGRMKRRLRQVELYLLRLSLSPANHFARLMAAAVHPLVSACIALNNLRSRRLPASCPPYCSSALLTLRLPLADKREFLAESPAVPLSCGEKGDAVDALAVVNAGR